MIEVYSRDRAYFQSLRDRNMTIAYGDFDICFNELVAYLNNMIVPAINILAKKKVVGVKGCVDYYLRNVGDGTTKFDHIRDYDIEKHIITLDKLQRQLPCGVIASGIAENMRAFPALTENEVLVSDNNLTVKWSKLSFNHFKGKGITADKIAIETLSARHLVDGIVGKPLADNTIETKYIQNNTIPANKVVNNAFNSGKISNALMNIRVNPNQLKFNAKCFVKRTIADNSVDVLRSLFYVNQNDYRITQLMGILSPDNIKKNDVQLEKIRSYYGSYLFLDVRNQLDATVTPTAIKDGSFNLKAIISGWFAWRPSDYASLKLSKNNLSPELKAILVNKGGLKP